MPWPFSLPLNLPREAASPDHVRRGALRQGLATNPTLVLLPYYKPVPLHMALYLFYCSVRRVKWLFRLRAVLSPFLSVFGPQAFPVLSRRPKPHPILPPGFREPALKAPARLICQLVPRTISCSVSLLWTPG